MVQRKYIRISMHPFYPLRFSIFLNYKNPDDVVADIRCKIKTKKEVAEYLNHYASDFVTNKGFAHFFGVHGILVLPNFKIENSEHFDTLSHEVMHLVDKGAKAIGIKFSNDEDNDNEWYAYTNGYIMGRLHRELWK